MSKSTGLSGGFFDVNNISDDSLEPETINGTDQEDSSIPYLDDEDQDDEEDQPKPKKTKKPKSKPAPIQVQDEDDEEEEELEEEEEEEEKPKKKASKSKSEEETSDEDDEEESEEDDDEEDDELSEVESIGLDLIEKGVLVPIKDKEYDPTPTGLAELFEDSLEAKIKERVTPGYESILAAMELGVSPEEWVDLVAPDVEVKDADLDDVPTQKILIARNLEAQGIPKDKIQKKIEKLEKLDELRDEAEEAQIAILKRDDERIKTNQAQLKEEKEKRDKEAKETVSKIHKEVDESKEINGFYVSKKEQRELKEYITKPVNTKGQTQYMIDRNDPKKIVAAAFMIKNGIDAQKLTKVLESQATLAVKKKLNTRSDKGTSGKGRPNRESIRSTRMPSKTPWDDWGTENEVTD